MRKIVIWVLILMLCVVGCASAEKPYEIDEFCAFEVESISEYSTFFNQQCEYGKKFLVASVRISNLKTEPLSVKTEIESKIVYDEDFEFNADYTWPDPLGTYYMESRNETIYICQIKDGKVFYVEDHTPREEAFDYEKTIINAYSWYDRFYDPINDEFFRDADSAPDDPDHFVSQDPSKTVLDPIVERTFHYVFSVPEIVADDEGKRELILTLNGEEYSWNF